MCVCVCGGGGGGGGSKATITVAVETENALITSLEHSQRHYKKNNIYLRERERACLK